MLAGLMPQGSVLPLDLIGIEGARVFRKNMLRYDDPFRKNKNFDFCATFLRLGDADSFPSSTRRKWAAVRPICRFFGLQSAF